MVYKGYDYIEIILREVEDGRAISQQIERFYRNTPTARLKLKPKKELHDMLDDLIDDWFKEKSRWRKMYIDCRTSNI